MIDYAEMFEGPNQGKPANHGDGGAFPFLAILFDFLATIPLPEMEPHDELVNAGRLCLAQPGVHYVCYAPAGGVVELDLRKSPRSYDAQWLNPRTGLRQAIGTAVGGDRRPFACPDKQDWILQVKAQRRNSTKP